MEKISYNLVFNRKKRLNKRGMALVQVEAYLNEKDVFLHQNISQTGTVGCQTKNGEESS